jgi:hypothetical protein
MELVHELKCMGSRVIAALVEAYSAYSARTTSAFCLLSLMGA